MPWINHLPPVCWSTFGILVWNDSGYVNLTQWWYFFIIFEYILHISTPHIMIFCFPLPYFPLSQQVLYFLLSTLVLTLYIDVVLSLSISVYRCDMKTMVINVTCWYRFGIDGLVQEKRNSSVFLVPIHLYTDRPHMKSFRNQAAIVFKNGGHPFWEDKLTTIRVWVYNHICYFIWDVIIPWCFSFNYSFPQQALKFGSENHFPHLTMNDEGHVDICTDKSSVRNASIFHKARL